MGNTPQKFGPNFTKNEGIPPSLTSDNTFSNIYELYNKDKIT